MSHLDELADPDLPEQLQIRRAKRDRLLASGVDPYPVQVPVTISIEAIRARFPDLEADSNTGDTVSVAGRVMLARNTGKLCFATLQAGSGETLQAMLSLDRVGGESLAAWKADVDLGDLVSVTGEVISSRRGELSVLVDSYVVAAKALRPLPVAHKSLSDETRVRQRYLDLIMRPEARATARLRSQVARSVRDSFFVRDYLEVETPMLQTLHGGAAARPFSTHMNAYDMELSLRIAPELFLKRCVVGGLDRVFEMNRNFRNEGADSTHSPEFVMIESYEAYGDYNSMAALARGLIQEAAQQVFGSLHVKLVDGSTRDLSGEWRDISMYPAVTDAVGREITPATPFDELTDLAGAAGLATDPLWTPGKFVEELFEHYCRPELIVPTFVRDFPADTSPLVKGHRSIPGVVEKWDLYIDGIEVATGYSELNDPVVQRDRFLAQGDLAARGDAEAMLLDEEFLAALEHGMPPTGGMGMGLDRMLMVLTGLGIRETILFPLVKPLV